MKNVLIVVDKETSAIDILSRPIKKYNPHLDIAVLPVHPKKPDNGQLNRFKFFAKQADVIHYQYWKTAEMLREKYDWLKDKPSILSHYNPYDVDKQDWFKDYDVVTTCNTELQSKLPKSIMIPLCTDLKLFKFQRDYVDEKNKTVNMVAGRIEGSKGIAEVAQACNELGYKFVLVGRISDGKYFKDLRQYDIEFKENVTDLELRDVYYDSAIHICNSKDGFESGTLPVLEAMATGCPVLTRRVGHIPDIENGSNMVVRTGAKEDMKDLKEQLKSLMEDYAKRKEMRETAFKSIVPRDIRNYARDFGKMYSRVAAPGEEMVSIVVPTFNRLKELGAIVKELTKQTYKNFELVIADDGSNKCDVSSFVDELKDMDEIWFPIKYVNTGDTDAYHLAKARNLGAIEATGDLLIFMDDRYKPDKDMIKYFVQNYKPKFWLFGDKGANKRHFVENFSCVGRQDFINMGMFNERIEQYGGMSQEIRKRLAENGLLTEYTPAVKCEVLTGTKNRYSKKDEIIESKYFLRKLNYQ